MAKPSIIDIDTLIQAGINPKTGLPIKFGNKRCTTKEDIKKFVEIIKKVKDIVPLPFVFFISNLVRNR